LKSRLQATGIRHQGLGNEAGAALAGPGPNGVAPLFDPVASEAPAALPNGQQNLKPVACSLIPIAKPDA